MRIVKYCVVGLFAFGLTACQTTGDSVRDVRGKNLGTAKTKMIEYEAAKITIPSSLKIHLKDIERTDLVNHFIEKYSFNGKGLIQHSSVQSGGFYVSVNELKQNAKRGVAPWLAKAIQDNKIKSHGALHWITAEPSAQTTCTYALKGLGQKIEARGGKSAYSSTITALLCGNAKSYDESYNVKILKALSLKR